jgi:hypothetical protein
MYNIRNNGIDTPSFFLLAGAKTVTACAEFVIKNPASH